MDHIKAAMEQARQQRKRLQGNLHANTVFFKNGRDSTPNLKNYIQHIFLRNNAFLFIGGAAMGGAVLAIAWWMNSAGMAGNANIISQETAEAIQASNTVALQSDTLGLTKAIDNIAHLYERVESLTAQNDNPAINEAELVFDTMEPTASGIVSTTHETMEEFTPTHTVNARLNLRPAASLSTTPITVLKVGTYVEYISEIDGWYYVYTESSGKGWCASNYLSSL